MQKEKNACNPIINGFVCDVSQDDIDNLKYNMKLNSQSIQENTRIKTILTDQHGNQVGIIFKNGESGSRLFSKHKLL